MPRVAKAKADSGKTDGEPKKTAESTAPLENEIPVPSKRSKRHKSAEPVVKLAANEKKTKKPVKKTSSKEESTEKKPVQEVEKKTDAKPKKAAVKRSLSAPAEPEMKEPANKRTTRKPAVVEEQVPEKKTREKKVAKNEISEEVTSELPKRSRKKPEAPKEEVPVKKVVKKKASPKKKSPKTDDKEADEKEASPKSGKKLQNSVTSDYNMDFGIKEDFNLKITMWNVGGLRACAEKNCNEYFEHENADIICLNELKIGSEKEVPESMKLDGYHAYWNVSKGEPGVAILTKVKPLNVSYDLPEKFKDAKRLITAEYEDFYLVCCYVVNAGRGLKTLDKRLEWNDEFDKYITELDEKKPVIIAGDMNVSHQEIDLHNPKTNKKNAGFTQEERDGFTKLLSYGFVDTFRHFYPDATGKYTFWSYMSNARAKNVGWRLDYFIVSERFIENVKENTIRDNIKGSDHCPIVLFLDL